MSDIPYIGKGFDTENGAKEREKKKEKSMTDSLWKYDQSSFVSQPFHRYSFNLK